MQLSEEQALYIEDGQVVDTKLLATAGSGKTFSIIQRINYLITQLGLPKENVLLMTFSKHARSDFVRKLKKDKITSFDEKNVYTIDSYAYKMLGEKSKEIDISILSYTFKSYLDNSPELIPLELFNQMKQVTDIFVDEAQDLNPTQYGIVARIKQLFGTRLHLVGDPNQNIYQFRNASDKFLINFPAKTYYLSTNYRSNKHIVDFCNFLRPYDAVPVKAANNDTRYKNQVTFYATGSASIFEKQLLDLIYKLRDKLRVDLHKVAILSPTKGQHSSPFVQKGLCFIAHTLYANKVPFKQFYSDTSNDGLEEVSKSEYRPKKGHINLITMTSSKGLEWDYVILIDVNAHLITPVEYSEDKYKAELYLLYVAASRPRKNLFIFTAKERANPFLMRVPDTYYTIDRSATNYFKFYEKNPTDTIVPKKLLVSANKIVRQLKEEDLFALSQRVKFSQVSSEPLDGHEWEMPRVSASKSMLLGCVMEHFFYVYMTGEPQHHTPLLKHLYNAMHNKQIYCSEMRAMWWYNNLARQNATWAMYDEMLNSGKVQPEIQKFVDTCLSRSVPFYSHTLISKYYMLYIQNNLPQIKKSYEAYLQDPEEIYNLFYISAINYAIDTMHYYYIEFIDQFYEEILVDTGIKEQILSHVRNYAERFKASRDIQHLLKYKTFSGLIDFVSDDMNVYEVKCTKEVRLADLLQVLAYNMMYHECSKEQYHLNLINLGTGVATQYECNIPFSDQKWFFKMLKSYQ